MFIRQVINSYIFTHRQFKGGTVMPNLCISLCRYRKA